MTQALAKALPSRFQAIPQGLLVPSQKTSKSRVLGWIRKMRAGELVFLAAMLDVARVEDAVPAVEPAVRAPGQGVGELVGVVAAEAGDDDLAGIGLAVAVGVFQEEDVRASSPPRRPVAHRDAGGDVQPFGENLERVGLTVAVRVLNHLDPVSAHAGRAARYSRLSVIQTRPRSSNVMATGLTISGSLATSSTLNPSGTVILAIASAGDRAGPGG